MEKLTDSEKKLIEYTEEEVAEKCGIYSEDKLCTSVVHAFFNSLPDKDEYSRTRKIKLPTGKVVNKIYYNELFVEKLMAFVDS